jgi:hypothetical protein
MAGLHPRQHTRGSASHARHAHALLDAHQRRGVAKFATESSTLLRSKALLLLHLQLALVARRVLLRLLVLLLRRALARREEL